MPNVNISDKDMTSVILDQHKFEASSLSNLVLESVNSTLRKDVTSMLQRTFTHQKQLYDFMSQKGWYQVQSASQQDITNAQQTVNSIQTGATP